MHIYFKVNVYKIVTYRILTTKSRIKINLSYCLIISEVQNVSTVNRELS